MRSTRALLPLGVGSCESSAHDGVMRRKAPSRRWLLLGSALPFLLALLLLTIAVWFVFRSRGWTDDKLAPILLTAAGLSLAIGTAFAGWLRLKKEVPAPAGPTEEGLEQWRVRLRQEVVRRRAGGRRSDVPQGSDLFQMLRGGTVIPLRGEERLDRSEYDLGRPRLQIRARTLDWSEITAQWDGARGRMAILGPAGYGKTVAALTLLKHINTTQAADAPLAELFPLAEWYRWQAEHPDESLSSWLADQLAKTYPETRGAIARAVVDGPLVPVLDGLDEVPASHRQACKEAIDAYAEPSEPFRPFIVTCRPDEYAQLAPDWVSLDREVTLLGLDPDQVRQVLEERTAKKSGWDDIGKRVAEGDERLLELFRSPLRLAIALQAYRDRDASELGQVEPKAAEAHLWDQLLMLGTPTFHGAGHERIRSWLHFLATGMQQESRQRFWLHELYLFAPDRPRALRRFRISMGLAGGLGVAVGTTLVGAGFLGRRWPWLSFGLGFGLVIWWLIALVTSETPSVTALVPLRARLRQVTKGLRRNIRSGVGAGLVGGLVGGMVGSLVDGVGFGLATGLATGLVTSLGVGLMDLVKAGNVALVTDSPRRLAGRGLSGGITATRNAGLVGALVGALAGALGLTLVGALVRLLNVALVGVPVGDLAVEVSGVLGGGLFTGLVGVLAVALVGVRVGALFTGLVAALFIGLIGGTVLTSIGRLGGVLGFSLFTGLVAGLGAGLSAWFYHHCLRRQLAGQGLIPRQLREFLHWCAAPERGWLRVSDACEFRHRELLEHLARASEQFAPDSARDPQSPSGGRPGRSGARRRTSPTPGRSPDPPPLSLDPPF